MEIGFSSIGNATIVAFDNGPVLVTDPWVEGSAYFGSWSLSHEIPEEQKQAIAACKFVWFSHGHPDHLNPESLALFRGKKILLPDHIGQRIHLALKEGGYDVQVLQDRTWVGLSDRIRVLCISDYNQDAVLLIDVGGYLLVNLNDASNRGWGRFVRKVIRGYKTSFMLALSGFGDADMINLYDENGVPIRPYAARRHPVGEGIAGRLDDYGCRYFIPSSSMHIYQREDSVWANRYVTALSDYPEGFNSKQGELLPAYINYDLSRDGYSEINPLERRREPVPAAAFGDNWNDVLEKEELARVEKYFRSIEHLKSVLTFVGVRVGGKDHIFQLGSNARTERGLIFEAPRGSLMAAIDYEIFDDLLIGNFMKVHFRGTWSRHSLYPDFTPYVAKYADNGRAKSEEELKRYFLQYRERSPLAYLQHHFIQRLHWFIEEGAKNAFRSYIPEDGPYYRAARTAFRTIKKPPFR